MHNLVADTYGNQVRVRACGICIEDEKILLINHKHLIANDFWAPPGGGIAFGEPAEVSVKREFREETGLSITVGKFLFACEFINSPLHAIELFFETSVSSGVLKKGMDPEMDEKNQIIQEIKFMSAREIELMKASTLHGLFLLASKPSEILRLSGYFKL